MMIQWRSRKGGRKVCERDREREKQKHRKKERKVTTDMCSTARFFQWIFYETICSQNFWDYEQESAHFWSNMHTHAMTLQERTYTHRSRSPGWIDRTNIGKFFFSSLLFSARRYHPHTEQKKEKFQTRNNDTCISRFYETTAQRFWSTIAIFLLSHLAPLKSPFCHF